MKQSGCKILMVGDRRLVTSVSTIRSQYLSEATKMKPAQSMTLRQSAGLPSLSEMYSATCLRMISMPVNMWLRLFPGNVVEGFPPGGDVDHLGCQCKSQRCPRDIQRG